MDFGYAFAVVSGLAIVSVLVAYWMAAHGALMESRFGRVVFCSTVLSVALWLFLSKVVPTVLESVGISSFDLGVLLVGGILLAGAAAALFDFVDWFRGAWTTPPPPFQ